MTRWLLNKPGGLLAFLVIAGLVLSGLGWLTSAAIRLEEQGNEARARARQVEKIRLALWRLDSLLAPVIAREDSRPFQDYSDLYAPVALLQPNGFALPPGQVFELSPLVSEDLPAWLSLHFQVGANATWTSPQVFTQTLANRIEGSLPAVQLSNRTPSRREELTRLKSQMQAKDLVEFVQAQSGLVTRQNLTLLANTSEMNPGQAVPQYAQQGNSASQYDLSLRNQSVQQSAFNGNGFRKDAGQMPRSSQAFLNDDNNQSPPAQLVTPPVKEDGTKLMQQPLPPKPPRTPEGRVVRVALGPMTAFWKSISGSKPALFLMRTAKYESREFCQGILLDWTLLEEILRSEIRDLLPNVEFQQISHAHPPESEPTLASLPILLVPGPDPNLPPESTWSALRFGLILAWSAALIALGTVALGGWSLIDLSERRFRFVSAVTHELRTPLTTLRLYLDMLAGGMIREEKQRDEYLHTLNAEADRLNRLVGNVLDFSRLENQKPRLMRERIGLRSLLDEIVQAWNSRCLDARMNLIIEQTEFLNQSVTTDVRLIQQILGNLIDNACKYCSDATDRQIRLRAIAAGADRLALEVEDHGPGISVGERRSIFRAFQRGQHGELVTGGVGLGLALAERWARFLGGRLTLKKPQEGTGACFRLEIPFDS